MNVEQRDAVLKVLWPEGSASKLSVWGILDCARDPKIYLALLESRLEFRCLYSGRLPRALESNAPHLVELLPGHRLTLRWLEEGWGRSWGVMVKIDDSSNLRHHLRKFLKVRDEGGRTLLFRYYDPRVLRAYLPTCTDDECAQLFGPVHAYIAEASDGEGGLEFGLRQGRLVQQRFVIPPLLSPAP
jgi:hypothetical protein